MDAFFTRRFKDQRGAHVVELGFAVALFAMIAAFGLYAMGDAVADYFVALKCSFGDGNKFADPSVVFDECGGGSGEPEPTPTEPPGKPPKPPK